MKGRREGGRRESGAVGKGVEVIQLRRREGVSALQKLKEDKQRRDKVKCEEGVRVKCVRGLINEDRENGGRGDERKREREGDEGR